LFQRLLQFHAEDTPDEKLGKLEQALSQYQLPLQESVPLFAPLLALPLPENHYPPLNLSPQRQRQKTLETLVAILLELAEQQPVLFILEDLHWTDPTTLEFLGLLVEQVPTAAIYTLLTCRPHFQPAWHHRSYITEMTLNHLAHPQVEQLVTGMTDGTTLPKEVLQQIIAKTDGVPLFVEEMTKAILESGHLKALDGHYELTGALSTFAIPATLQDSLMARLDRLVTAKAVAQYAAVIGRQFSYALLHAVSQLDEAMLQHELDRLVETEIVYHRGVPPQATYTFKHALIQDAAYQSLLKSTRQQYHRRIAQVFEAQLPETAEAEPELLAQHYTEAGLTEQAVAYWQRAGQQAVERSAYAEAVSHLTTALDLLTTLPETRERSQQELAVQMTLGMVLVATKGFAAPEVAHAYTRAHALCREVGDTPQLISVLSGLYGFHVVRAEFQTAQELAEQYLTLAHSLQAPTLLGVAHRGLGQTTFWRGALVPARAHLQQSITLYNPEQRRSQALSMGQDPGVTGGAWLALTLWLLGYPDQARQRSHEALTLAQELSHPFTLVVALTLSAWLHHFLYERHAAQEQSEAAIRLATEQGFAHWVAWGTILRGAALAEQGQRAEGLAQIRQGLDAYRATGGEAARPYWLAQLAEACQKAGQPEEGLTLLTEALATAHKTGEGWWEAEIYRLRGELLSQHAVAQPGEAETWLQRALAVARRQEAKSLELRAAMSLARLWQQQGKHAEAYDLLAPIYGWFTEGFDTADLQEAKALVEALA